MSGFVVQFIGALGFDDFPLEWRSLFQIRERGGVHSAWAVLSALENIPRYSDSVSGEW